MSEDVNILTRANKSNVAYGPEIQRMAISLTAGTVELIAAVTGQQIQIMAMTISVEQQTTLTLKTGSDTIMPLHAGGRGGINFPNGDKPWFVGKIGQNMNLVIATSPGASAGAVVIYRIARAI